MVVITKDSMVVDPTIQKEIARRAVARGENIGNQPNHAVYSLGEIDLLAGPRKVWMRNAVDAIVMDPEGNTVLIRRKHNPGAGKWAIPGGFIDDSRISGGIAIAERCVKAALRELSEETSVSNDVLKDSIIENLGDRKFNRPFDIREAYTDMPDTPIKKGDFVIVSTQGFLIKTQVSLDPSHFKASDDATEFKIFNMHSTNKELLGIQDHVDMLATAHIKMADKAVPMPHAPHKYPEQAKSHNHITL